MSDKRLVEHLALGAAVGVAGTIALQGLMIATQRWLPTAMPQIRKDPGEFIVEKAKQSLPPETSEGVPAAAETAAAKSLALGYGATYLQGFSFQVLGAPQGDPDQEVLARR